MYVAPHRPYDRGLVALFAAVMLIASSPTYGQNGAVGIAYPAKGITVDGDLSDWPKTCKRTPSNASSSATSSAAMMT